MGNSWKLTSKVETLQHDNVVLSDKMTLKCMCKRVLHINSEYNDSAFLKAFGEDFPDARLIIVSRDKYRRKMNDETFRVVAQLPGVFPFGQAQAEPKNDQAQRQ